MQCFRVVYCGISHGSLVVSSYTHEPSGECVCKENTSEKRDILWYITRKPCITILCILYILYHDIIDAVHDGKVGCDTVELH